MPQTRAFAGMKKTGARLSQRNPRPKKALKIRNSLALFLLVIVQVQYACYFFGYFAFKDACLV